MYQDNFYNKVEANSYFLRWKKDNSIFDKSKFHLRDSKKEILYALNKNYNLKDKRVLEIGCFIGDLLNELKRKYNCSVCGIEPSSLACKFAKKHFKLIINNSTFLKSKFFLLKKENFQKFDLIIIDDVLSWIDRSVILSTLAVVDWMLKPKGIVFLRDFSPPTPFALKNHHWKKEKIYNFKQAYGHKKILLETGKYIEISNHVRSTSKYQKINTKNKMSTIWSDSIIKKIEDFTHPILKL
jgi:2-polyprenyl-3-methyl-5-hydroxy-6-metoxy-1,4-benzoquinol methylase